MNKLLEYFGVKDYAELIEYMKNNPDDEKTKEMKEILEYITTKDEENKE